MSAKLARLLNGKQRKRKWQPTHRRADRRSHTFCICKVFHKIVVEQEQTKSFGEWKQTHTPITSLHNNENEKRGTGGKGASCKSFPSALPPVKNVGKIYRSFAAWLRDTGKGCGKGARGAAVYGYITGNIIMDRFHNHRSRERRSIMRSRGKLSPHTRGVVVLPVQDTFHFSPLVTGWQDVDGFPCFFFLPPHPDSHVKQTSWGEIVVAIVNRTAKDKCVPIGQIICAAVVGEWKLHQQPRGLARLG